MIENHNVGVRQGERFEEEFPDFTNNADSIRAGSFEQSDWSGFNDEGFSFSPFDRQRRRRKGKRIAIPPVESVHQSFNNRNKKRKATTTESVSTDAVTAPLVSIVVTIRPTLPTAKHTLTTTETVVNSAVPSDSTPTLNTKSSSSTKTTTVATASTTAPLLLAEEFARDGEVALASNIHVAEYIKINPDLAKFVFPDN